MPFISIILHMHYICLASALKKEEKFVPTTNVQSFRIKYLIFKYKKNEKDNRERNCEEEGLK